MSAPASGAESRVFTAVRIRPKSARENEEKQPAVVSVVQSVFSQR